MAPNSKAIPWFYIPPCTASNQTATIIGGGLAGTSTAYALAASGWQVTLIERLPVVAGGASGNRAGIVMPLISHASDTLGAFYAAGFEATLAQIHALQLPSSLWRACGVIDINPKHAGKPIEALSVPARWIEPVSFRGHKGLYFKAAGHIDVPELCAAQLAAHQGSIHTMFCQEALSLEYDQRAHDWHIKTTQGLLHTTEVVIIANSHDLLTFEQTAWLPVHKVRGQVTLLPERSDITLESVICREGYMTPAHQGYHHIGATYARENHHADISMQDHQENMAVFETLFGFTLNDADYDKLKGRVGFRCATPDRRAIVGPAPIYQDFLQDYARIKEGHHYTSQDISSSYYPNLYINTAHGSRGLTSCILSAAHLAAMINGISGDITAQEQLLHLLLPTRFIIRQLKQAIRTH